MSMTDTILIGEVQAIPMSKPLYTDNLIMCGLLVCAFVIAIVLSDRKHYFARLLKDFFLPRETRIEGNRTTDVIYLRTFMYAISLASTAMILALYVSGCSLVDMNRGALWLTAGVTVSLFYILKILVFATTNRIFFDSTTTKAWEQGYACWTTLSCIPLFLMAVIAVFFNLGPKSIVCMFAVGLILLEICLLYKAFHIFSAKKYGILQIFIYLCTLELMPLLIAAKALVLFV